jgi:hypothetical protein
MSLYTIVFVFVTFLLVIGLMLFGLLISKLDRWIDRKERLGKESIYRPKDNKDSAGEETKIS